MISYDIGEIKHNCMLTLQCDNAEQVVELISPLFALRMPTSRDILTENS